MTHPNRLPLSVALWSSCVALSSALALGGCSLDFQEEEIDTGNTCDETSGCGVDGACVSTQDGAARCAATAADLGQIVLEVRPSSGAAAYVFFDAINVVGESDKGLLQKLDLELPAPVEVSGRMLAKEGTPASCKASDGSLVVNVKLTRRAEFSPFISKFEISGSMDATSDGSSAAFSISVPPGDYDVYLEPQPRVDCVTPAPMLIPNVKVEAGQPLEITAEQGAALPLTGVVTVPVATELEGWVLEVVDPTYGAIISQPFLLSSPSGDELAIDGIEFHKIEGALVRLRDGEGNLSVHWELSKLDLNSDGFVEVDLFDLITKPESVEAHVIDEAGVFISSAAVSIRSTALTGNANQNANYRVDTRTDAGGFIHVDLVPGDYSVTIVPDAPGLATYFGTWSVSEEGGSGLGFILPAQPTVSGSVTRPDGLPMTSASVVMAPAQTSQMEYVARALLDQLPAERQFSTPTDDVGGFSLFVDPGELDLSVQMPADTGFPWLVLPSLKVDAAEQKPVAPVGELSVKYPVFLQGSVRDAGASVPFAVIRAWVRSGPDSSEGTLVQVGATTTDSEGAYVLPLPPGITLTESAPSGSLE